jgi:hypothetical protein
MRVGTALVQRGLYRRRAPHGHGFVKLLRRRRSSGNRGPLPGQPYPLGRLLRTRHISPTREARPPLLAVRRRGPPMPSGAEVVGKGVIRGQKALGYAPRTYAPAGAAPGGALADASSRTG